jgi:hypothetical protein
LKLLSNDFGNVVVDLDRSIAAEIIYVGSVVIEFRFVKAIGGVLVLAEIVNAAPIFVSIGLKLGDLSLVVLTPFIPILLTIGHRLVSLWGTVVREPPLVAALPFTCELATPGALSLLSQLGDQDLCVFHYEAGERCCHERSHALNV